MHVFFLPPGRADLSRARAEPSRAERAEPRQAKPGRAGPAEPSQADLGRRLGPAAGRLLDLASFKKSLFRLHETHTFGGDLQNRSFRLREMATFRTPSSHLKWMTPAWLTQGHPPRLPAEKKRAFRLREVHVF